MTSRQVLQLLQRYESRNITYVEADGSWPIVWKRARGTNVWDEEGRQYLDLTAAFGVAAAGHANPRVVKAGQRQMETLLHAMGDVHPHALKAQLARELSQLTFGRWQRGGEGKTIFCNSGFEAVEAALKTARLATGKSGVITFEGAYHGTGYGTLNATSRRHFWAPFKSQLRRFGHEIGFPTLKTGTLPRLSADGKPAGRTSADQNGLEALLIFLETDVEELLAQHKIGAILVEPFQARGGINLFLPGFQRRLRRLCDKHGLLLIFDEIYTGFGRTGKWFGCEHEAVTPDIVCLGKALTGGFPLSACVGRAELMDRAWPASTGEAIHTSTYLGHPVGCAMALAQIAELKRLKLPARSARLGGILLKELSRLSHPRLTVHARGIGLMAGVELTVPDDTPNGAPATREALDIIKRLLHRGFIFLPEGEDANVISLTPPLTITEAQLHQAVNALRRELGAQP